ncbi:MULTISPECIES: hypothetical protein [Rhizobium]|uniref:Uncharacterized protein n=1 Tax=Rhizobium indicum TaxID=2583231 RepID=A0ABX6PR56_9HYPH|nr:MULTISPECIES: hypothetical protein [Rhizobium]NEI65735.1 hypothetical protein [Rhizobium leguminosarum]QKK21167.1 hypothetical protein FFM53_032755 [Rhizobium indicum]QKK34742.1 hypothetical protein FE844_035050 [Rhizobium indicum]
MKPTKERGGGYKAFLPLTLVPDNVLRHDALMASVKEKSVMQWTKQEKNPPNSKGGNA